MVQDPKLSSQGRIQSASPLHWLLTCHQAHTQARLLCLKDWKPEILRGPNTAHSTIAHGDHNTVREAKPWAELPRMPRQPLVHTAKC